MPSWDGMGGAGEDTEDEPECAALEWHLDHEDCQGLDRAVVIELLEVTARTAVFEPEGDDWLLAGPPVERKLRSRPDVDHRADLAVVADDARAHIEAGLMTDFVLTGHGARNGQVVALFRERLGADRVFTPRLRPTRPVGRLALVGAGVAALLALILAPIGLALNDSGGSDNNVLGSTTERSAAAAPSPTLSATTVPPTTVPPTTVPPTTVPPAGTAAPTTLGPIDTECQATVFAEPGGVGQAWTFAAGEHDLLLEPRGMVVSITLTGSGCHVRVCTEWAAGGTCEVVDDGTHDVSADIADGASYLRVG